MQVIELDDNGIVQSWHTLESEEDHVEWLGGCMFLLPCLFQPAEGSSLRDVWQQLSFRQSPVPAFWLWSVSGLSLSAPDYASPCRWKHLF